MQTAGLDEPQGEIKIARRNINNLIYADYNMWTARLDEAHAKIKIARRNINNFRYVDDTALMVESEEELKSPLIKVKEESEKVVFKAQHSET